MKNHPFYEALNNAELGFKTYAWPTRMNPLVGPERLEREKRTIGENDFIKAIEDGRLDKIMHEHARYIKETGREIWALRNVRPSIDNLE